MQPQLILHFAGADTIYQGIARPVTAAKKLKDEVVGITKAASQTVTELGSILAEANIPKAKVPFLITFQ